MSDADRLKQITELQDLLAEAKAELAQATQAATNTDAHTWRVQVSQPQPNGDTHTWTWPLHQALAQSLYHGFRATLTPDYTVTIWSKPPDPQWALQGATNGTGTQALTDQPPSTLVGQPMGGDKTEGEHHG